MNYQNTLPQMDESPVLGFEYNSENSGKCSTSDHNFTSV